MPERKLDFSPRIVNAEINLYRLEDDLKAAFAFGTTEEKLSARANYRRANEEVYYAWKDYGRSLSQDKFDQERATDEGMPEPKNAL